MNTNPSFVYKEGLTRLFSLKLVFMSVTLFNSKVMSWINGFFLQNETL
ncbi:hypothetical protein M23134_01282 [Microscilla marina ATCC 23134]|uniref:Uncharacterized protein n=1 Tax=Microscilla marina ATCC 23134 TaxID=313606 RepID=A2A0G9_MICM2|nr:hypothetical protein M23134_01282 [Microscilla marina ATCC 23134]